MADYRVVQEPWGGWYTVTPDGRWIGPYQSEAEASNIVEGTFTNRPVQKPGDIPFGTGKPVSNGPFTIPGPITDIPGPQTSMSGLGEVMNQGMDSNNYVAPDGQGGFIVVVNGQVIPGSPFKDQGEAERAYNAAGGPGSTPTQTPTANPGIPSAPSFENPFNTAPYVNVTPPDKSPLNQVIAWIWNNHPDIRENYKRGGWDTSSWDGIVAAINNWLSYPANVQYGGDAFAAAMDLGLDESYVWTKDKDGNYVLTSPSDMKANYGTENPWEREAPDVERYWVSEGLVTGPNGKQQYRWRNAITGEYRWTDENKNPSQSIPTMAGATQNQMSWDFADVLRGIGLDANNLNWNVSSEWHPDENAKAMFKDPRLLPASLDVLTGGKRDETMNRTQAAGFLQGSTFVQNMNSEAAQRGIGTQRGDSGFEFVAGRHLPARQVMNALNAEGEEGTTAKLLTGMAEYSGQNPNDFWTDFKSHLPTGGKNPLTRYI